MRGKKFKGFKNENSSSKLPIIIAMANKVLEGIGFTSLIDESVEWNPARNIVTPGNLAKSLVLATFRDVLQALQTNWKNVWFPKLLKKATGRMLV